MSKETKYPLTFVEAKMDVSGAPKRFKNNQFLGFKK